MAVSAFWTKEKLDELRRHVDDGMRTAVIAKLMGASYSSTYAQVVKMNMTKPAGADCGDSERLCLRCREPFKSSWIGNRVCRGCQSINSNYADVGGW